MIHNLVNTTLSTHIVIMIAMLPLEIKGFVVLLSIDSLTNIMILLITVLIDK